MRGLDGSAILGLMKAAATTAVICAIMIAGSISACSPPRKPVTLDIDLGEGSAGRCVVIYELQQRAGFGMATYWPVHIEESGDSGVLQVSKSLCPDLIIEAPGGPSEALTHDGGRATVDLTDAEGGGRCDAAERLRDREDLEAQIADAQTARCAGW